MNHVPLFKKIGEGRYKEVYGLWYEDFQIGAVIEHALGRTITETDNIWMSLLCFNTHPLHIDRAYGEQTQWGKNLVSSLITLSIVGGLSLQGTSARCHANLGWEEIKLISPVFVGDTLYAETHLLSKRESNSRQDEGIVTVKTIGKKQDGTICLSFIRSFLVPLKNKKEGLSYE